MNTHTIAPIAPACAPVTKSDALPRPTNSPPRASAAFKQRNDWCQSYAAWFVSQMPEAGPLPLDVRPTHRIETEVQFCQLDPRQYELLTTEELTGTTQKP